MSPREGLESRFPNLPRFQTPNPENHEQQSSESPGGHGQSLLPGWPVATDVGGRRGTGWAASPHWTFRCCGNSDKY